MNESLNFKGHVNAVFYNECGYVKQIVDADNLITNAGKNQIMLRIGSNTQATCSHIAVGSGVTAANISDTAMGTLLAVVSGSMSNPTTQSHQVVATFGAGVGTGTITEYGLYASGSALIGRIVNASVVKAANDTLQVTYTLSIT